MELSPKTGRCWHGPPSAVFPMSDDSEIDPHEWLLAIGRRLRADYDVLKEPVPNVWPRWSSSLKRKPLVLMILRGTPTAPLETLPAMLSTGHASNEGAPNSARASVSGGDDDPPKRKHVVRPELFSTECPEKSNFWLKKITLWAIDWGTEPGRAERDSCGTPKGERDAACVGCSLERERCPARTRVPKTGRAKNDPIKRHQACL